MNEKMFNTALNVICFKANHFDMNFKNNIFMLL